MSVRLGIAVALVAALALTAGACGDDEGSDGADEAAAVATNEESFTIGYSPPVLANPAIKALADAVEVQGKELGMEVIIAGGEYDPSKQLAAVDSLIQRKVDAILVWPLDPKSMQPAFARAADVGIPMIVQNSPTVGAAVNFQTNDGESAENAANALAEALGADCGDGASVAIIQGIPQVEVLKERNEGLAAGAKAAGCTIVAQQVNAKDSADGARPIVDAWKTKYGADLKGILAYNDSSAVGAAAAINGDFKPLVTGINADQPGVDAVKDGRVLQTWDLRTPEIGNGMAWAAHELLTGNTGLPKTINVEMVEVSKDNVDGYPTNEDRLKAPLSISIEERDGESYLKVGG
jgi:ABC-type sugar transport system substrate-binding protein